MMNHQAVTSSNIASVGYDEATRALEVQFNNGSRFRYEDVSPEQHQQLLAAPSIGSHFHAHIKHKHVAKPVGARPK